MLTKSILITGCNRGLGLELVRQLAENPAIRPQKILCTVRNTETCDALNKIRDHNQETVSVHKLEVTNFDAYPAFLSEVEVNSH